MAGQSARLVRLNLGLPTSPLLIYLISAKKSSNYYDLVKKKPLNPPKFRFGELFM